MDNIPSPLNTHSRSTSAANSSISLSTNAVPHQLRSALHVYEPLAESIAANYDLDEKLPAQKRLIANIMQRMEIDKKELSRREDNVRKLLDQKNALATQFSFAAIQASFWGNLSEREQKLKEELLESRNSLELMKKQANDTSDRLIREIILLESMDERNVQLSKWRKELQELMDRTFEEDKEDIALRLRILSSKSNFSSALDQMDRHKAAEGELKTAKKLFTAAVTLLRLLEEKDSEIPDWFRAKFIFDAKLLTTQADLFIQNAFSIDTTLPDHEAIPPPPASQNQDPTITQTLVKTLLHRSSCKLDRIAATNAYIAAAKNTTTETITRAKAGVFAAQEALNARRIQVMETALEIVKQSEVEAGWKRADGSVVVAGWMLPVEGVSDIELRSRPTPGPVRIVNEVPTAPDLLPEYAP
ncbi:hypothetical protein HDU79_008744 [Rhizoclosmatium sp. JEL0117]|nr:hypothetical protein HDU79_008744 [Rhizoclosmatium sp. JEL0117]